ncbi:hypothetical protein GGR50DRAFT_696884 [Xylaria sp. CBS 124048]|nr:hypothetical protein GGR50DRAFT_696884 [Xylaria sp. CBS 124048]
MAHAVAPNASGTMSFEGTELADDSDGVFDDDDDDACTNKLSQREVADMILDLPTDANEDALEFTARADRHLKAKSTATQKLSLKEAKRPRTYNTREVTGDTLLYLQKLHNMYRLAFGLYLNRDPILALITKTFRDFQGSPDVKENAEAVAYVRLRNLCSSWKMKTLKHLEEHVQDICKQDRVFKGCKDLNTLHSFLKNKFDPDNWAEILEPWRKSVNVRASGPSVQRWSRSIYVDLGARMKLYIDWKDIPATERPVEATWDKEAISHRFDTLTRAPAYERIRPVRSDFVLIPRQAKKRVAKRAKRVNDVVDTTTDPNIFIDDEM